MIKDKFPLEQSPINKILTSFVVFCILSIAVAFFAMYGDKKSSEINNQLYQHPFLVSNSVHEVNSHIVSLYFYLKEVVIAVNGIELDRAISSVANHEQEVNKRFKLIKERYLGNKQDVEDVVTSFAEWKLIRDEVVQLKRAEQDQQAAALNDKSNEYIKKLNDELDVLVNFAHNKALELNEASQRAYKTSQNHLYPFTIVALLSCVLTALLVMLLLRKLQKSKYETEVRYEALFNNAEVSIWSEDFSLVVEELEELRQTGIVDLKDHLYKNMNIAWGMANKVKVNSINDATLVLFGAKSEAEFIKKIDQTFGNNAIEVFIDELCAIWNKEESFISEANFNSLDGKEIQAVISFRIPKNINNLNNVPITLVDITEHKKLVRKLRLSSRVYKETNEGILITDANKKIIDVNPAFLEISGYSVEDLLGHNPKMLSSGKHSFEYYKAMWDKISSQGYWQGEIWNRKKNGEVIVELLNISSLKDHNNKVINYIGMFTDITQSKRQQENIHRMAHYDALTGLSNRRLLLDRFNLALAHSKRSDTLLAVCFLDLDDFKPVNDSFGHEVGDKLLIEVARRLELAIRAEDTVSRLGGDEFALLLGNLQSTEQCNELLSRIIQTVSDSYLIEGKSIKIGASIGVSVAPLDGSELDPLLRQADQAMYLAKQEGKHHHQFFDLEREKATTQRNVKLQDMRRAITNNELCLYYQPKVNMAQGKIIGVEALIRWHHPEKGTLSPIAFLPLIEGTPLEIDIGNLVIEQAMKQLDLLNANGINIKMSVNVSSLQLLHDNFFEGLKASLQQHQNIDPTCFDLEILESSSLGDLDRITNIINACRDELGVSIALDDFGTGYSSLSHLSQLPADVVKIDQSFIRNLLIDPDDFAITDGVIGLTKSFSRSVIAEGVETEDDGLMLLLMGCHNAQGYAISKPIPADNLIDWINAYQPNKTWLRKSNDDLNIEAIRVRQLELIFKYWFKEITATKAGQSDGNNNISHMDYCIGKWINRLTEEHLFKDYWLNDLSAAYKDMHADAKEYVYAKQQRNLISSQYKSIAFEAAFEKILVILSSVSLNEG